MALSKAHVSIDWDHLASSFVLLLDSVAFGKSACFHSKNMFDKKKQLMAPNGKLLSPTYHRSSHPPSKKVSNEIGYRTATILGPLLTLQLQAHEKLPSLLDAWVQNMFLL